MKYKMKHGTCEILNLNDIPRSKFFTCFNCFNLLSNVLCKTIYIILQNYFIHILRILFAKQIINKNLHKLIKLDIVS